VHASHLAPVPRTKTASEYDDIRVQIVKTRPQRIGRPRRAIPNESAEALLRDAIGVGSAEPERHSDTVRSIGIVKLQAASRIRRG
jgi:hypothetical protein